MVLKLRHDAYKRIKNLGEDVVRDLDHRLLNGATSQEIADFIQNDLGQCNDIKNASLVKTIERYRASELKAKTINRVINAAMGGNGKKGMEAASLHKRMNALDELEELTIIQKDRFHKMFVKEKPGPLLMKSVTQEAVILQNMLVRLGQLQLETGMMARVPRRIQGELIGPEGQVTQFEWTEEQEALMKELSEVANGVIDGADEP